MWKDRIRPGNPEKLGVTRAGRELNFAVAVQDGKDCSLLLYRKGMDEPELELGFTDDMRFGEICAMGLEGLPVQEYEYNYKIDRKVVQDPYAAFIRGREIWGKAVEEEKLRCQTRFESFSWAGGSSSGIAGGTVCAVQNPVRGFTMDPSSVSVIRESFAGIGKRFPT